MRMAMYGSCLLAGLQLSLMAQYEAAQPDYIYQYGIAAHYRPGLMTTVSNNRGMEPVSCMIATPDQRLGQWVIVVSQLNGTSLNCRITDYAHPKDRARIKARGIVAELDYLSAEIICEIDHYGQKRPEECPIIVMWEVPR